MVVPWLPWQGGGSQQPPSRPHRHAVTPSTQLSGTAPSPVLGAQVRSAWPRDGLSTCPGGLGAPLVPGTLDQLVTLGRRLSPVLPL